MTLYNSIDLKFNGPEGIATLSFDREDKWNAFSYQLVSEFCKAMDEISKNESIRCLILTGKGKAFSVGGDIKEFKEAENPVEFMSKMAFKLHEGIGLIKSLKIPIIAAINGLCYGAALGYICACDLRFCVEEATFGTAFTGIGLSTDSSTSFFLPKIVGLSLATEMIMLNKVLTSQDALKSGLISSVYTSKETFLNDILEVAIQLSNGAPLALWYVKDLLNQSYHNHLEAHLKLEAEKISLCAGTEDFQEGLNAFLEKRKPNFKGK